MLTHRFSPPLTPRRCQFLTTVSVQSFSMRGCGHAREEGSATKQHLCDHEEPESKESRRRRRPASSRRAASPRASYPPRAA
jgi:hypothetical protein